MDRHKSQQRRTGTFGLGEGAGGGGGGDLLARKKYAMPECVTAEIGMQTHSKQKPFTMSTSNETPIIPKLVIFKACILNDLY